MGNDIGQNIVYFCNNMTKVLVTGVNGFVGKHLVNELSSRGIETIGLDHRGPLNPTITDKIKNFIVCDLTSKAEVSKLPLNNIDGVINLAGLANVGDSFNKPELYMHVNVAVLQVIGDALLNIKSKARIIAVSTGALYDPNQSMPLKEDSKIITEGSPYALSKLAMEKAASSLRSSGLDCIVARPFNHIGPGQGPGFLLPDLHTKLVQANSSNNTIKVGNLNTKRDYTDVRDVVRAYADLIQAKTLNYDVYNICSGTSHSGQEILSNLQSALGLKEIKVKTDPSLIRPNDPQDLYGSSSKLQDDTRWQPKIPLPTTVKDFVESNKS